MWHSYIAKIALKICSYGKAIKLTVSKLMLKFYVSENFHLYTASHIYLQCTVCSDLKVTICDRENSS